MSQCDPQQLIQMGSFQYGNNLPHNFITRGLHSRHLAKGWEKLFFFFVFQSVNQNHQKKEIEQNVVYIFPSDYGYALKMTSVTLERQHKI